MHRQGPRDQHHTLFMFMGAGDNPRIVAVDEVAPTSFQGETEVDRRATDSPYQPVSTQPGGCLSSHAHVDRAGDPTSQSWATSFDPDREVDQ